MKYLFGPVNSRRLGLSLGIDLLPAKICNFNCIYCEVGPTTILTCERKEYTPTREIIAEVDSFLATSGQAKPIDVFTITASGEPTLHSGLGEIINHLKARTALPVAVLTNGSLLFREDVRQELEHADIVIPSLDSAGEESFRKINRPAQCVKLQEIIDGLCLFARNFRGELWLEILLSKGINDSAEDLAALRQALIDIKPAKIQLNTVVRPPLEEFANPLTETELEEISRQLPGTVEIIADFHKRKRENTRSAHKTELLEMLRRRPCTETDICEALNLDGNSTARLIKELTASGEIAHSAHRGKIYYQTSPTA
ncbi:MAG: radical SAM protein [Proteobacteria bacterium]|nr:radical SAM protein [Pseudomonadota bacterium]MBU0966048.1 radical SAM protein [Pseudomonadota bacterium]